MGDRVRFALQRDLRSVTEEVHKRCSYSCDVLRDLTSAVTATTFPWQLPQQTRLWSPLCLTKVEAANMTDHHSTEAFPLRKGEGDSCVSPLQMLLFV